MISMPDVTAVPSQRNLLEQFHEITAYLQRTQRIGADEQPRIRLLTGGVSNHTVLVERDNGQAWVMKQALAQLRVVETEWFSDPGRIHREAEGLRYLKTLAPHGTITPLIFEDHDLNLLAMEAVPQPHDNWKDLLLQGQVVFDYVRQFAQLLGTIHRAGYQRRDEDLKYNHSVRRHMVFLFKVQLILTDWRNGKWFIRLMRTLPRVGRKFAK